MILFGAFLRIGLSLVPQETADCKRVTALGQLVRRRLNGLDEFSIERPLALAVTLGTRLPVTPQIRATL